MPEQMHLPGMVRATPKPNFAAGLSKPHIRTATANRGPKPSVTWYPGASLVDINIPSPHAAPADKNKRPRGKIKEWSAASRSRLKMFMGTLRREALGRALVVTLTYPAEFPEPEDHEVYKCHLHTFAVYLRRRWPLCSGIWKLEFQTRGAAHYHLMLFGLHTEQVETVRAWVREIWYSIAHNGDKHQGAAGTQVDTIKTAGGAMCYLVKYLSKGDQTMPGNFSGRYWGKINVQCLPVVQPETLELSLKQAMIWKRIARTKVKKDVEESRWKRFLKQENEQFWRVGGRLFWECLQAARQGTKRRMDEDGWWKRWRMEWMFKDGGTVEHEGSTYHVPHEYQGHLFSLDLLAPELRRLPKRWRSHNNDRTRLLCWSEAFMESMKRLNSPASTFRDWVKNEVKKVDHDSPS